MPETVSEAVEGAIRRGGNMVARLVAFSAASMLLFACQAMPSLVKPRLEEDGLVELQPDWIVVTPKGRLVVRVVCMAFDRYLRERERRASYSKVI